MQYPLRLRPRGLFLGPCLALLLTVASPGDPTEAQVTAYVGATVWDGTGSAPIENATLLIEGGRVLRVGADLAIPSGSEVVRLEGKHLIPGLVNAHGHVSGSWAPDDLEGEAARIEAELLLYARYGITTVNSLGDGPPVLATSRNPESRPRARLQAAGAVVAASDPTQARRDAEANAAAGADWLKLRVDDNLGTAEKMPWDAVQAVADVSRERGVRLSTHLFYLEDAKRLLRMGSRMMAHSVRDRRVDAEFLGLMASTGVCYVPTLTRELSTFVYASRPDFLDDRFFLRHAKPREVDRVTDPAYMRAMQESPTAAGYRVALTQAQENLRLVARAGIPVAMGTDTGPAGRFPGYFEHLELDMMADAGLSPREVLLSATSGAAACLDLDEVGSLTPGRWADFLVLGEDPLRDVSATRSLERVYIGGVQVE